MTRHTVPTGSLVVLMLRAIGSKTYVISSSLSTLRPRLSIRQFHSKKAKASDKRRLTKGERQKAKDKKKKAKNKRQKAKDNRRKAEGQSSKARDNRQKQTKGKRQKAKAKWQKGEKRPKAKGEK